MSSTTLTGRFLECCDCYTICPCWVNERPDEDHCSALYVWTFDPGSQIEGNDISGKSVVVAAFHGNRQGTQSAIYVDETLSPAAQRELIAAFSGQRAADDEEPPEPRLIKVKERSNPTIKGLEGLTRLVGRVVDSGSAKISVSPQLKQGGDWQVTVQVNESRLAHAKGSSAYMQDRAGAERTRPLTLNDTALHDELSLDGAVEVQVVEHFEMAIAPLPGAPFTYAGRSGMAAKFDYSRRS
jgi:hypothetical protein